MNFVSNELNLPLFLISRNHLKYHRPENSRNYISKKRLSYTRHCNQENATELNASKRHAIHLVGLDERSKSECPPRRPLRCNRNLISPKAWHLPPCHYTLPPEIMGAHRGAGGAHWAKVHRSKSLMAGKIIKPPWRFYNLDRETERMCQPCHKHKGPFVSNARERRASTRCMVDNNLTCYRNPKEPGPTTYKLNQLTMAYGMHPITKTEKRNPHIFYRHTSVPVKILSIHAKDTSFKPGPGRYECRYTRICACSSKLISYPGLYLAIQNQKLLKFRRMPYRKIKVSRYCCPDFRHVPGNGHTWIFMNPTPIEQKVIKSPKDTKKTEKTLKLYAEARYIHMINDPDRVDVSIRLEPLKPLPIRIKFNCMAKRVVRRQLQNNKKIAFNSSQERWKDGYHMPPITASALAKNTARLPLDRQCRDYAVMSKPLADIQNKLSETPKHMMAAYQLELRKRLFKFLPLPPTKILVTERDTRPPVVDGVVVAKPFYMEEVIAQNYFKTDNDEE